jgi:hypothetical protein
LIKNTSATFEGVPIPAAGNFAGNLNQKVKVPSFSGSISSIIYFNFANQIGATMDDDENVGYKRPPRRSQFKPGQSGNPSGKAKGLRSMTAELRDILGEEMTFAAGGAVKTMSKQRALASSLVTAAIEGDLRATAIVMAHLNRDAPKTETAEEEADFSAVEARQRRRPKNK